MHKNKKQLNGLFFNKETLIGCKVELIIRSVF